MTKVLRIQVRNALVLGAVVVTAPLWIPVRLFGRMDHKDNLFRTCAEILSLIPGLVGVFLRRGFYWMSVEAFGMDCTIEFGTWIAHRRTRIGRCVYIGARCTLGMCTIGDFALLGSNVDVLSGRHTHGFDDPTRPICTQDEAFHPVRIGRDTWLGNSAVIMADIGDNSVIGAGSVVVKPIPPGVVAAGNPCTVRKCRTAGAGSNSLSPAAPSA